MKDKILSKTKFPFILGTSALFIALCAACFSVYGIATLFAGASISAMIMASSLEVGKLVGTTFLYRYWDKCNRFLKVYLISALVILMAITSFGIFGYLSAAYQKSSIEFVVNQEKIKTTEEQKPFYQDKITTSKKRIEDLSKIRASQESRFSEVLTNEFLSRNPLQLRQLQQQTVDQVAQTDTDIKTENDKIQDSIEQIRKLNDQVNLMKIGEAGKKDVQTFKFVADALKLPLDTVARWFIIFIIFVFDPLAVCLILAYNVAVYTTTEDDKDEKKDIVEEKPKETELLKASETLKPDEKALLTDAQTNNVTSPEHTPNPPPDLKKSSDTFFNNYFKV